MSPFSIRPAAFAAIRQLRQRHGVRFLMVAAHRCLWWLARRVLGPRRFTVDGRSLRYFLHPFVIDTERCVEIAIAREGLDGHPPDAVLEVGNVLSTYQPVAHRVLDRYEEAPGVVNEDAADFAWPERFRRIVCLSTLEHVGRDEGLDEAEQDPTKAERALVNLRRHLGPDGRLLVTFPLGYHPQLDAALAAGRLGEQSVAYLQRTSRWNTWIEIDAASAADARFGAPFPCGNVIAVLRFAPLDRVLDNVRSHDAEI